MEDRCIEVPQIDKGTGVLPNRATWGGEGCTHQKLEWERGYVLLANKQDHYRSRLVREYMTLYRDGGEMTVEALPYICKTHKVGGGGAFTVKTLIQSGKQMVNQRQYLGLYFAHNNYYAATNVCTRHTDYSISRLSSASRHCFCMFRGR